MPSEPDSMHTRGFLTPETAEALAKHAKNTKGWRDINGIGFRGPVNNPFWNGI